MTLSQHTHHEKARHNEAVGLGKYCNGSCLAVDALNVPMTVARPFVPALAACFVPAQAIFRIASVQFHVFAQAKRFGSSPTKRPFIVGVIPFPVVGANNFHGAGQPRLKIRVRFYQVQQGN